MMGICAGANSRFRYLAVAICCATLYAPLVALAEGSSESAPDLVPTPTLWRATTESVELPGGEKMGLLGLDLLFDVNDSLRLGVGTYGAVRGEHGGFITLGLVGEAHQRLSPNWLARAGLFVGAGGGRGGYTLSGGGLMLRGDVGLSYETGRYGNFGFGVSHVQFPSGVIHSTQPYLQYDYPFFSLLNPGWSTAAITGNARPGDAAVPVRSTEFALVTRTYKIPSSVVRDDGLAQHSSMQLLGVEWLSYLDQHWFLKLESEGAMGGQSNGYMQILAGGGYRYALSDSMAVKLHAAAGPAGGGGVDTGGGLLLDAGISLSQKLSMRTALELSLGEVHAPSKSFNATSLGVKLNYQFGLPDVSEQALSWSALSGFDATKLRARVTNQTYFKAAPLWRNRSVDQSVSNLGVQVDYFVSPNWFLTGQGLAAYAGDAGAYMTGQVGVGLQQALSQRWFVEGEALLGAAGGGGLAVGGGLVGQGKAAIGYRLSNALSLLASAGRVAALKGDFRANVAGMALVYQFVGFAHR
jgi:hypothetical protein